MADSSSTDYQAPQPAPELQRLSFLVGKWQTKGSFRAHAYGPAGSVEGEHTWEWFNEYFLKHTWKEGLGEGVEYIGYDEPNKRFHTHYFDNNGPYDEEGSTYEGAMRGDSYVQCGPARITYTPSSDGKTMKVTAKLGKKQRSQGLDTPDSEWEDWLEATYTKVS
jgi:hypothetical protein